LFRPLFRPLFGPDYTAIKHPHVQYGISATIQQLLAGMRAVHLRDARVL
jgi:hypothetical protein